jgi:hypothetical protein
MLRTFRNEISYYLYDSALCTIEWLWITLEIQIGYKISYNNALNELTDNADFKITPVLKALDILTRSEEYAAQIKFSEN